MTRVPHKALIDQRMQRRIRQHHLPLAMFALVLVFGTALLNTSRSTDQRLSIGTAYAGLILLGATLFTGPLNVLRGRANPVSTDLRRDIGIWAAIIGIAHVIVGLRVHLGGDSWLYFFEEVGEAVPRFGVFGWANWIGLAGAALLIFLLALSNDYTLRKLGRTRWKTLQRLNYILALGVVVHAALYQYLENRQAPWVWAFLLITAFFTLAQIAGVMAHRARSRHK